MRILLIIFTAFALISCEPVQPIYPYREGDLVEFVLDERKGIVQTTYRNSNYLWVRVVDPKTGSYQSIKVHYNEIKPYLQNEELHKDIPF